MLYRGATPFFSLRRDIDRLFEEAFGGQQSGSEGVTWRPAVDVRDEDRELVFEFELPGIRPEDVEITAENGVLSVRGEKKEERKEGEEGRFHVVERTYGQFYRSFQLPQGIKDDEIQADYDNGVLRIRVPKAELARPRKIEIGAGAQRQVSGSEGRQVSRGDPGRQDRAARQEESGRGRAREREGMAAKGREE